MENSGAAPSESSNVYSNESEQNKKVFTCHLCKIHSKYDVYGTRPLDRFLLSKPIDELTNEQKLQLSNSLNNKKKENIILLEKSYICDDPFSPLKASNYLVLGSNCTQCNQMVCVSNECSFFYYKKRFCLKCAEKYIRDNESNEFPQELKAEILKIINNLKTLKSD